MRTERLLAAGTLALALSFVVAPLAAGAQISRTEARVAMRDGAELATTIWLPEGDATPRATLLRRTPYGRTLDMDTVAGVVGTGYALVSQDVRGRGESDGTFSPFRDDAHDGYDTIAWIAAQPWSNARVGTFGGSAEGIVQLMAAGEAPPALRCALPMVATGDVHEALYPGGAWRAELGTAWLEGLMEPEALVVFRGHEARDAFWDPAILDATEIARIAIPIRFVGGFYDIFSIGTTRTFHSVRAASAARDDATLVLGPWTHGGPSTATQGEVTYAADSVYTQYVAELVAFFDWCLRDGPRPDFAPVRYYVTRFADDGLTASGEWRDAQDWPPAGSTELALHLHGDGTLRTSASSPEDPPIDLASDPGSPVPSRGGGNLTTPAGPHDQLAIDARDEVFVAETVAVGEEVEIVGDVRARITAASASDDVDVIVRLSVRTPEGRTLLIADGVRRGRFARTLAVPAPLTPGEPTAFDVDVGPVALVLAPGHRLRVAVQATSAPRYEPSPGSSTPILTAVPVATTLTLYTDSGRPSTITLPVVRGASALDAPPTLDAGTASDRDAGPAPVPSAYCGCRAAGTRTTRGALALFVAALAALGARRGGRR